MYASFHLRLNNIRENPNLKEHISFYVIFSYNG